MTEWEEHLNIQIKSSLRGIISDGGVIFIEELVKIKIKDAVDSLNVHYQDNCDCGFCEQRRKLYRERGIE